MNTDVHNAYTFHQRKDETVRETESHALLSCASKLEAARDPSATREEFGDALRHNQQLWTLFQVCLCEPDNPLPRDLKGLLLNLGRYVDKTTFRALADENRNLLRGLISINRHLAAGLSKTAPEQKAATPAPIPPPVGDGKPLATSV